MRRTVRGTGLLLSFGRKRQGSAHTEGPAPSSENAGLRSEGMGGCPGGGSHLTEQERKPRLAQGSGEAQDAQRLPERSAAAEVSKGLIHWGLQRLRGPPCETRKPGKALPTGDAGPVGKLPLEKGTQG